MAALTNRELPHTRAGRIIAILFLVLVTCSQFSLCKNLIIVLDEDEGNGDDVSAVQDSIEGLTPGLSADESSGEWEEFGDTENVKDEELDPGSWRQALEHEQAVLAGSRRDDVPYVNGIRKLVDGVGDGDPSVLQEAITNLKVAADGGHAHAQSTLAFLYSSGYGVEQSDLRAHLYHYFAAEGGNFQSKMALAYSYSRQQLVYRAVKLYAELAAAAMASHLSSKEGPLLEPVRLNDGFEESKEFKKFRGEDDDDFQFLEYKAHKGFALAMYRLGIFYYFGLRGVPRDHVKALYWFLKAVDKGDHKSMELLGEIYARGLGVERNYTKALDWFEKATAHKQHSALNGIGWLYAKGYGVDKKNFTKAKEYFKKAADAGDYNGHYNLGVLYLKGLGLKKDVKEACRHFMTAVNASFGRHPKALYQLAKMQHKGIGVKKDEASAVELYKLVAERGPWGSLLKWALECYRKGQVGQALLLYSRAAELGYEVAQSNAAWILDKYGNDVCLGSSGFCTDAERHQRAHILWRYASEQDNEYAALLIGDAYYYGRGTGKDLERAAEAYMRARLQKNAQAMFNLGYMYEHGLGLPMDLHLAKRYYDQAVETDNDAALPVTVALAGLWLRQHYGSSFLVRVLDMLPEVIPKLGRWLKSISLDEGNVTLATLFVCLLTVLYLRQRHRRAVLIGPPPPQ